MKSRLVWPTTDMVDAAINNPSSMAPASPMKIRAGWKLCGRNPRHSPKVMIEKSGPELSGPIVPRWINLWEYRKNAADAMPTIPAASPSSPSTKLTALAIPTTHSTVTTGIRSAERTTVVPAKGRRKNRILMPNR